MLYLIIFQFFSFWNPISQSYYNKAWEINIKNCLRNDLKCHTVSLEVFILNIFELNRVVMRVGQWVQIHPSILGKCLIALIDYFASLSYMTIEAFYWKSRIWKGTMHLSVEIHNNKGLGKALVFLLALKDKSWKSSQSWILFTLEILFEVVVVRSTPISSSECPRFALTILILSLRLVSKVRG